MNTKHQQFIQRNIGARLSLLALITSTLSFSACSSLSIRNPASTLPNQIVKLPTVKVIADCKISDPRQKIADEILRSNIKNFDHVPNTIVTRLLVIEEANKLAVGIRYEMFPVWSRGGDKAPVYHERVVRASDFGFINMPDQWILQQVSHGLIIIPKKNPANSTYGGITEIDNPFSNAEVISEGDMPASCLINEQAFRSGLRER